MTSVSPAQEGTGEKGRTLSRSRIWDFSAALVVLVGFALLLWLGRDFWFYKDDWNFLLLRTSSLTDLLRPHVNHWQATQVLWYRYAYSRWGLSTYFPYLAAALGMHAVASGLMYWALVRMDVRRPTALAISTVLLLFGNGAPDYATGLFVGGGLSRVMYVAVVGIIARPTSRWGRVAITTALLIAITSSGLGLNLVLGLVLAGLIAKRGRELVVPALPALVLLGLWYWFYGFVGLERYSGASAGSMIEGLKSALTVTPIRVFQYLFDAGGAFSVVLGGAIVILLGWRMVRGRVIASEWLGLIAAGGFLLELGIVRFAAGGGFRPGPGTPRYAYVLAFFLAPALARTVDWLIDRTPRLVAAAAVVLFGVALVGNIGGLYTNFNKHARTSAEVRTHVESAASYIRTGGPFVSFAKAHPHHADPLTFGRLRAEMDKGWRVGLDPRWVDADLVQKFAEETQLVTAPHPAWKKAIVGVGGVKSPNGCVGLGAMSILEVDRNGLGWIDAPPGAEITVALIGPRTFDVDKVTVPKSGVMVGYAIWPGEPGVHLEVLASGDDEMFCGVPTK